MKTSPKLLSVILSFRNEEAVLSVLIDRLVAVFAKMPYAYELIFINDASSDGSLGILNIERERNPSVKILNMSRRFGVPACLEAGLDYAAGDAVIMMDADLQDPPEMIPEMIQKWQAGAEVVHTVRTSREGESQIKMAVTMLGYRIWQWFWRGENLVNAGDFKLLSRRAVSKLREQTKEICFLRGAVCRLGLVQERVFYKREKRFAGKTHFPMLGSWGPARMFLSGILASPRLAFILPVVKILNRFHSQPLYRIDQAYGFSE